MEIGERIKHRREELGITQEQLAKKIGYADKTSVNKIEKGLRDFPQSKLKAFSDALLCSPGYLMGWEENLPSNTDFIAKMYKDPICLDHVQKLIDLDEPSKKTIYDMIDFQVEKMGRD